MGTGYVRQSTVGNTKSLDVEFDNLESAFDGTTGHSHDGTTGEGQLIDLTTSVTGILPSANMVEATVGTPAAGVTATEHGASDHHQTHLSFTNLVLPDAGNNVALGVGVLLYTFPAASAQIVVGAQLDIAITIDDAITTDTPDVGLGTVIATGAISVLSSTGTFENILTGQALADVAGTRLIKTAVSALVTEAGGIKSVYLNVADTWAATTTQGLTATGVVTLDWVNFSL